MSEVYKTKSSSGNSKIIIHLTSLTVFVFVIPLGVEERVTFADIKKVRKRFC